MQELRLSKVIQGVPTSDGAGVKLIRSIGRHQNLRVDPFLMLDAFSTDQASDYIGGFPPHPHRGFETVTYMLEGRMRHEDHMGNQGLLGPGAVQWMTAGRGVIHSEMPEQEDGRMQGFQLWLNLPAAEKMKPPSYRDIAVADIPELTLSGGGRLKLIAGRLEIDDHLHQGPINGQDGRLSTDPLYLDVQLPPATVFEQAITPGYSGFVYPYEAEVWIADEAVAAHHVGVLGDGKSVRVRTANKGARFLLIAGKPLKEPIAQYGPFVMNSMEEVEQAIQDYQSGDLTSA